MSEVLNPVQITEITAKVVAIVSFVNAEVDHMQENGLHRPGVYYQVTLDPKMLSPSGEFVRVGCAPGDELMGWQKVEALRVHEILGQWDRETDTPPQIPYSEAQGITMAVQEGVILEA